MGWPQVELVEFSPTLFPPYPPTSRRALTLQQIGRLSRNPEKNSVDVGATPAPSSAIEMLL